MDLLAPTAAAAGRCYGCFRPREDCFCAAIPAIDNRTHVLILQHKREQFHPFGTARIVERALRSSQRLVGLDGRFAAGLPEQRPRQLVVLDGTWHHAKTMFRDVPELHALPRFRLAPTEPSRYGFRREPHAQFISTVEAVIAALRILEPELSGLDGLMAAFLAMVNRQIERSKPTYGARRRKRPRQTFQNVPLAIVNQFENIVVAYGESLPNAVAGSHALPAYWVAERLATSERFSARIAPPVPLDETPLGHWELTAEDFAAAVSPAEARAAWQAFLRPSDVLTVYHQRVADLAEQLSGRKATSCLVIKSVDLHPGRRYGTLEELLTADEIPVAPPNHSGRAGRRLANVAAYVRHLHVLANNIGRVYVE
jgi:DTW domain-containing protein